MRSTAKTKRVLEEIKSGERTAPSEEYRNGVVATLRWMLREVSEDPMVKAETETVRLSSEGRVDGVAVPKPVNSVRRKR